MNESIQTTVATGEQHLISDEVLVGRLRKGEAAAGDELVRRHCRSLLSYLARLTGSVVTAEELHQQTWMSVLEHLDRFADGGGSGGFKAWLFRIATNKANDHWRGRTRQKKAHQGLRLVTEEAYEEASAALEGSEMSQKVREALEQLPEAQREVVCMRYYSNLKFVEIAEALGCPLNTALGRMHKAISKLRKLLEDRP
jgi:RNA polymerase sigma-70 factor (ECF subfamily)